MAASKQVDYALALEIVRDSLLNGTFYIKCQPREGHSMATFHMRVKDARAVLKDVFGVTPKCKKCGKSHAQKRGKR